MSVPNPRDRASAVLPDRGTPSTSVARLAVAARMLENRRDRLATLMTEVNSLARFDVIVVDGERAVLDDLAGYLAKAWQALEVIAHDPGDLAALERFEAMAGHHAWTVLDTVAELVETKSGLAKSASKEVQQRLRSWTVVAAGIEKALAEMDRQHLDLDEPREVAAVRRQMSDLLRQANSGFREDKLLDVWRALDKLDATQETSADGEVVASKDLLNRLRALIDDAKARAGRLQLTVLRGPLDGDRFEYTLMLLLRTGGQHIGVNVQDSTTIVRADRDYLLRLIHEAYVAETRRYSGLEPRRDLRPPAILAGPTTPGDEGTTTMRDLGMMLYRLLLPEQMKAELRGNPKTPLTVITNDLELPWELMCDDDTFIALSRPLARMPVGRSPARRVPVVEQRPARVALVASAGPNNELRSAVTEVERIRDGLTETMGAEVTVDVFVSGTPAEPTGESFSRILLSGRYDVIHYAGHAMFDPTRPEHSGLLLAGDELCLAQKIQRLLRGNPLVFLNACESARHRGRTGRPPPEGFYEGDPKEGLASAFLYGGALACVGTMWPVGDGEAADFAVAFYERFLDGQPLGRSMQNARVSFARGHPGNPSWASFVLYADPSFTLRTRVQAGQPKTSG